MLFAVLETLSPVDDSIIHTEELCLTPWEYEQRKRELSDLQELIVIEEGIA
ncbi:hypothetical protein HKD21_11415 [Gluconobacter cerevisiae]|uniref:Transposase n=2 Tax=Gluconobacter TaxID=441 RepID=A0ABR9YFS0_9PROT|nr:MULTISPECIES: hypothetical protein [Gluconobacter]MBF0877451.1 hypothetical protein [Gluconobacter cerevisiae]GBR32449.1 hypothetical protein AA3266_1082 [Gluconobacter kondonii NBRC 3266]GLQ65209.1 hypothetical protein GCM10007870_07930 [Gluconobacter kondonii]